MISHSPLKIFSYTLLALIAFAANSVLCRLALGEQSIDPASFTAIRMLSAVVALLLIIKLTTKPNKKSNDIAAKLNQVGDQHSLKPDPIKEVFGSWMASIMLFIYALTFSYAYMLLDTATGALILFASVQLTMICFSVLFGARLHITEWLGGVAAFLGFVYLVLPTVTAPSFFGFILMTVSGIAWGIYTLKGRQSKNPLKDTAFNFYRTLPLALILVLITFENASYSSQGIMLAVVAGAITSGIGYTIWYIALTGLTSVQASVLQLTVPIIAAFGGVIFVAESISLRLIISASIILGGILLVVLGKKVFPNKAPA